MNSIIVGWAVLSRKPALPTASGSESLFLHGKAYNPGRSVKLHLKLRG